MEADIPNPDQIDEITMPSKAFDLRESKYDWAYKTAMIKRDDYERIEKPDIPGLYHVHSIVLSRDFD